MISATRLEEHLKGCIAEAKTPGEGKRQWIRELQEQVGLLERTETGDLVESVNEDGERRLSKQRQAKPEDFSIQDLAYAIGGREFLESFNPGHDSPDAVDLLEAGPGIDPTRFAATNLLTLATGAMVEAKVLDQYEVEMLMVDQLVTTVPTRKSGERMIGTYGFASTDGDKTRKPGQPHPRAQFGDKTVDTPETVEKALACEVTKEAVFFDLTREVLDRAGEVGEALAYGKLKDVLDVVVGSTNPYVYNEVGYNTYQTSAPWINVIADNPLVNYADLDEVNNLFNNMTHPETGRHIRVRRPGQKLTILHDPARTTLWDTVLDAASVETGSGTIVHTPAPRIARRSEYNIIDSIDMRDRLIAAGVDATKALDYWFMGDFQRAFVWMENWPITVKRASLNEYVMLDRGLVAAFFANHRGVAAVKEPRLVVKSIKA